MTALQEIFEILAPKAGRLGDALPTFQARAHLPDEVMQQIRFYEAHSNRIFKVIGPSHPIAEINDFMSIYCERIPEEEQSLNEEAGDRLVSCFHFEKEASKTHSTPFLFMVKEGEVFKETKERLSKRAGIKGKLLEKVRFCVVRVSGGFSRPPVVEEGEFAVSRLLDDYPGAHNILTLRLSTHGRRRALRTTRSRRPAWSRSRQQGEGLCWQVRELEHSIKYFALGPC